MERLAYLMDTLAQFTLGVVQFPCDEIIARDDVPVYLKNMCRVIKRIKETHGADIQRLMDRAELGNKKPEWPKNRISQN